LSLFGYDFATDHQALLAGDEGRVNLQDKLASLILTKPVNDEEHGEEHGGGKRFEFGGWEYWVLRRWIEHEAPLYSGRGLNAPLANAPVQQLERLEVTPRELSFERSGQIVPIQVIAQWADGAREDVTCLCRFQTNDDSIVTVDEAGLVTNLAAGDTHVVVSYDSAVEPVLAYRPLSGVAGENYPAMVGKTEVDRLVLQKLKKLGVVPAEVCSDEAFLRRVSLDVTGTLPGPQEVLEFLTDERADKRELKLDELLQRPSYAAQWATFLCDMTGNNEDQLRNFLPQSVRPENQWYQWLFQRLRDNMPYDQIVEGIVTANSRLPGESYREYCQVMSEICQDASGEKFAERPGLVYYWARNNFKTPEERAVGFAYTFLGVRIQCAQCHKHPFDRWSKDDFENFQQLFEGVQANPNTLASDARPEFKAMATELGIDPQLKGNDLRKSLGGLLKQGQTIPFPELTVKANAASKRKGAQPGLQGKPKQRQRMTATVARGKLLGGEGITMEQGDVRDKLMEWLRDEENPYFARSIVNRVWAHYFGVGIVNPPDDLTLANAPSNAELLDYLSRGFVEHGFDLRWLHRQIVNSETYQRSWVANETNALDRRNFSRSQLRRLPAEATYDAVRMALSSDSMSQRAAQLQLPRALTKPGASARSKGVDDLSYAMNVFGRSVRESNCDCDRSHEPSLLQTVFMVNDEAVQQWLSDPRSSQVAERFGWPTPPANGASRGGSRGQGTGEEVSEERLERVLSNFRQRYEVLSERLAGARQAARKKQVNALLAQHTRLWQQALQGADRFGLVEREREQLLRVVDPDGLQSADGDETGSMEMMGEQMEMESVSAIAAEGVLESGEPQSQPSAERRAPGQRVPLVRKSAQPMTDEQSRWIADNAYLRTLSRTPSPAELSISMRYLRSETDPVVAVQGLMWGLINTKEFVLNH